MDGRKAASTALKSIKLDKTQIKAGALQALLASSHPLTSLDISSCELTTDEIKKYEKELAEHKTLTELNLYDNDLEKSGTTFKAILAVNRILRKLNLGKSYHSYETLSYDDLKVFAPALIDNIVIQEITTYFSDATVSAFLERNAALARLTRKDKTMEFKNTPWGESAFDYVSHLFSEGNQLTSLSLTRGVVQPNMTLACVNFIIQLPKLTSLDLSGNALASTGIQNLKTGLKGHPNLKILILNDVKCDDTGATELAALITPHTESDGDVKMEPSHFLSTLQELYLADNDIGVAGFTAIVAALKLNKTLTTLFLDRNAKLNGAIELLNELLLNNATLTSLSLPISYDGKKLYLWVENVSLTTIQLPNKIPEITAIEKRNRRLLQIKGSDIEISFDAGYLGKEIFRLLSDRFQENRSVRYLTSKNATIHDKLIKFSIPFITAHLASLLVVDFSNNLLKPASIKLLADVFKTSICLTHLDLSGNLCGDKGAMHIADLLKSPVPLAKLFLRKNAITTAGLRTIALSIPDNTTLAHLDLSTNRFSKDGLDFLAAQLNLNQTITGLNLQDTTMSNEMLASFLAILDPLVSGKKSPKKPKSNLVTLCVDEALTQEEKANGRGFKETNENRSLTHFLRKNQTHRSTLLTAALAKNLPGIKTQLAAKPALASFYEFSDDDGNSLLHIAVMQADIATIEWLLDKKFNRYLLNQAGKTAEDLAIESGNDKIIKLFNTAAEEKKVIPKKPGAPDAKHSTGSKGKKRKPVAAPETDPKVSPPPSAASASASAAGALDADSAAKKLKSSEMEALKSSAENSSTDVPMADAEGKDLFALISDTYLASIPWHPEYKLVLDKKNPQGYTPLYFLIATLKSTQETNPFVKGRIDFAHALITHGADPSIRVSDHDFKVENSTALHRAVATHHYRLMKIILLSPNCDPNAKDGTGLTALDLAVIKRNIDMLNRLLIDRRLTNATIETALKLVKNQIEKETATTVTTSPILQQMQLSLEEWLRRSHFTKDPGIQWTSNFFVKFGNRSKQKELQIDFEGVLAHLMKENQLNRQRLAKDPDAKAIEGNPINASITFIVSSNPYQKGNNPQRTYITVNLADTFAADGQYHLKVRSDKDEKDPSGKTDADHFIDRVKAVPDDVQRFLKNNRNPKSKPLTADEIKEHYDNFIANRANNTFHQLLHHGEQSFIHHLEQKETIDKLLISLMSDSKFKLGCKVYGIVVCIHGLRYTCGNCEMAILGAQSAENSLFLRLLRAALILHGCVLPTYSPFKMLTLASSYQPYPDAESVVTKENHTHALFDLRCDSANTTILARDELAFASKSTHYHSRTF